MFELQGLTVGTFERYTVRCARCNRAADCIETFTFGILLLYYSNSIILEYVLAVIATITAVHR